MLQLVIEFSLENLLAVMTAWISWPLAINTFLREKAFRKKPLASTALLGFWSTQIILPICATSLEGNPATYNLEVPFLVFLHNGLIFLTLLIAWKMDQLIKVRKVSIENVIRKVMISSGVYSVPGGGFLCFAGAVGLAAMIYTKVLLASNGDSASGMSQKVIEGMLPMMYLPYLLFARSLWAGKTDWRKYLGFLAGFSFLLLAAAIGGNSRAVFMQVGLFIALAFIAAVLSGVYRNRVLRPSLLVATIVGGLCLTGPLSDLATAMVIVRSERTETDRFSLILRTLETYSDEKALDEYRDSRVLVNYERWDERYVTNIFLSRFCNLKFADNSLSLAVDLNESAKMDYLDFTVDRTFATLPNPVISRLQLTVDKNFVNSVGWGDYLLYLNIGNPNVLGGFRVGHIAGTGIAAFGWAYLFVLFCSSFVVFRLLGLLTISLKSQPVFTPISLLLLCDSFMLIQRAASVAELVQFTLRGFWQAIFIYVALFITYTAIAQIGTGHRFGGKGS